MCKGVDIYPAGRALLDPIVTDSRCCAQRFIDISGLENSALG
jgi:hypothetical protein